MHMMTSKILKFVEFTKTQKSRCLENETCFLQIKKFFNYTSRATLWQKIKKQPPEVFYKKGVLRNFAKLTVKYLCQSLFFNKVAGGACKKELSFIYYQK